MNMVWFLSKIINRSTNVVLAPNVRIRNKLKIIMKTKLTYISFALLLAVIAWLWFRPAKVKVNERIIEDTSKINQLNEDIKSYDQHIILLHDSLDFLRKEIELKNNRIKNLQKQNNEKTALINSYNSDELVRFLSNRYK